MRVGRKLAFDAPVFKPSDRLGLGGFVNVGRLLLVMRDDVMSRLLFVLGDDFMRWTEMLDSPVAEPHAHLAHPPNAAHTMAAQNRSMTFVDNFLHSVEAFLLEDGVSDRKRFIEDDDFRGQMCRDRKANRTYMPLE
jgi:hypothetical protein